MVSQMSTAKSSGNLPSSRKQLERSAFQAPRMFVPEAGAVGPELLEALGVHSTQSDIDRVWSGVKKRFGKGPKPGRISSFKDVYHLPAVERDTLVKAGVPSQFAVVLIESMGVPKERFYRILNLSRSTLERKLQTSADMSTAESERVIGLSKLIGQVQAMVAESGDPEGFDAARWFAAWIAEPSPALGGRKPEELLETADGREAVSRLLAQMQSGAFA
jgi:putative toxin-antitoxin system antitoxin component (TIGR02293 family)